MLVRQRCPCRSRSRTTSHRLVFVSALQLRASRRRSGARSAFRPGAWLGGFSSPPSHVEVIRSLKFLGDPWCEHAPLYDPDPVARLRFSPSHCCLPRLQDGVGFRVTLLCFGAPSRGLFTRCVRFVRRVTPRRRNTRFQPGTTLCWTGFGPVGLSMKGFRRWALTYLIVFPLSEAFLTLPALQPAGRRRSAPPLVSATARLAPLPAAGSSSRFCLRRGAERAKRRLDAATRALVDWRSDRDGAGGWGAGGVVPLGAALPRSRVRSLRRPAFLQSGSGYGQIGPGPGPLGAGRRPHRMAPA